jgi:hypothetical protein
LLKISSVAAVMIQMIAAVAVAAAKFAKHNHLQKRHTV